MSSERSGNWMWSRAVALLDEAEQRHRHFFGLSSTPAREPVWEPPVDVFVVEHELHLVIAMPGVGAGDVTIELRGSGLAVRGERPLAVSTASARILRLEIPYGRLERRIDLPAGRYELLGHELTNGCLHIRLAGEWL